MHEPGPAPSACSGVCLRNICSDGTWQLVSERLLMSHVQMHISNQLSQTHSCSLRRALTGNSIRWLSQTLGLSRGGEGGRGSGVNKCWGFFCFWNTQSIFNVSKSRKQLRILYRADTYNRSFQSGLKACWQAVVTSKVEIMTSDEYSAFVFMMSLLLEAEELNRL